MESDLNVDNFGRNKNKIKENLGSLKNGISSYALKLSLKKPAGID